MGNDEDPIQEGKGILALQAFLSEEEDERLTALCREVLRVEGFESDPAARLHITLATWQVTPQELQLAQSQFASRLRDLAAITTPATVRESRGNDHLSYCLLPEPSPTLLQFHAQVHAKLAWPFDPWRKIDLPGTWWPHLGLCHLAEDKEHLATEPLRRLREIRQVTIDRIGLVSYFGPMRILEEVRLRAD